MKERPVLFSAPMVRAILEGRKSMTRRVVKLPTSMCEVNEDHEFEMDGEPQWPHAIVRKTSCLAAIDCPYGIPGDRLYVKETWTTVCGKDAQCSPVGRGSKNRRAHVLYRANEGDNPDGVLLWKSSRFMPRWASRILLEITNVRVERLQDITEDGAKLEGAKPSFLDGNDIVSCVPFYRDGFMHLWNDINGPGSWEANPWVWVISFRRIKP